LHQLPHQLRWEVAGTTKILRAETSCGIECHKHGMGGEALVRAFQGLELERLDFF
jgi:hypothetical protein